MIKVYEVENIVDAQLICDYLRSDDIDAQVHGSYLSGAAGELPVGTTLSIWIREPLYKLRALELIGGFEAERKKAPRDTQCQHCGEQVEGNYALCWQCGKPLPEPPS